MSEPACTHFEGDAFLVRPAIRGPQREASSKLECPKCFTLWRPTRGEAWIHAEELSDLEGRAMALAKENAQLRQALEDKGAA